MPNLSFNEPAGVLVKTTLVDFPGRVAGSFFLKGCNLRCPYCYNTGLLLGENQSDTSKTAADEYSTVNELFSHLKKRQGILSGLVISGGEPLLNPYTKEIILKAKELEYKVKLDTNGTLPEKLAELLENEQLRPDFVAMDIKTSPERYANELCAGNSKHYGDRQYFVEKLSETAKLVSSMPPDSREFRTVLVPPLVKKADIEKMAALLPSDASWQFAQFRNDNCLNPLYNNIPPYVDSEVNELISFAQTLIPGAALR